MDVIGRGVQYKVVNTHDGRVRKIPLTREEAEAVVAGWYAPNAAPAEAFSIDYHLAQRSCEGLQVILARHPALAPHLANPEFEEGAEYTQDYVRVFGDVLRRVTAEDGRKLLEQYAEQILLQWRYGFSETVFNPTVNSGVDRDGRIVLLDIGELNFNQAKVSQQIAAKRWLQAWSYTGDLPKSLRG
ncbi:MAG TPA: hypothetical protein VMR98_01495, partial [Candidatus Polarisedimenticolaceae bacterium]|nr:hypothetical protein [Candidatus Polarisedimenticolaceae bacterium]